MNVISIYLIEDSISFRVDLKRLIKMYLNEHKLAINYEVHYIQNYIKFYENLETENITDNDIFIIDIYLNTYFNGIDLGKKLRTINQNSKIIFLTSAADKAIDTINQKINPSAYLMKSSDMEITQMQLFELLASFNLDIIETEKNIILKSYTSTITLTVSDILFISVFKGARKKLKIKTLNSDLVVDGTLSDIKTKLSSPPFYLDFKSIIINNSRVQSISIFNQNVTFKNGFELELKPKLLYKLIRFQKGLK